MFDKILVPLDGSELAECVFPYLVKIAGECKVRQVILLTVCEQPAIRADYPADMPKTWEQNAKELTEYSRTQCSLYVKAAEKRLNSLGVNNLKTETRLGDAARQIVDYASQNDVALIIMASHGRSGPSRWALGSVAGKVFRSTCVPVMMIRGSGCASGI